MARDREWRAEHNFSRGLPERWCWEPIRGDGFGELGHELQGQPKRYIPLWVSLQAALPHAGSYPQIMDSASFLVIRGDWTPLELFVAGVQRLPETICAELSLAGAG